MRLMIVIESGRARVIPSTAEAEKIRSEMKARNLSLFFLILISYFRINPSVFDPRFLKKLEDLWRNKRIPYFISSRELVGIMDKMNEVSALVGIDLKVEEYHGRSYHWLVRPRTSNLSGYLYFRKFRRDYLRLINFEEKEFKEIVRELQSSLLSYS